MTTTATVDHKRRCEHIQESCDKKFLWECVNADCDREHHYMVVSPWNR